MFDLREHKDLIRRLVSEANQNDPNWKWSVNSIGKEKARIFWEYLEYCGEPEPFFIIELEVTGEGCWIHGKNEHCESICMDIVEDEDMPFLNCPLNEAIENTVHGIVSTAHECY